MSIVPSCPKTFNSSPLTLREALFAHRHAIHREPGVGCIFVAFAGNGYAVAFSDKHDAPIKYAPHISKGESIQIPFIVPTDGDFYRSYADLEKYLQPQSNQPGWECVPVISNGKEVSK